jgi:hypothetical protein
MLDHKPNWEAAGDLRRLIALKRLIGLLAASGKV